MELPAYVHDVIEQCIAHRRFDYALDACKRTPGVEPKLPDYEGWLGRLHDACKKDRDEGWGGVHADPMLGAEKTRWKKVEDSVPNYAGPGKQETCFLLQAIDREIKKEFDRRDALKFDDGYFNLGKKREKEPYVKVYGCLKTNRAIEFAGRLAEWAQKPEIRDFDIRGKFYEMDGLTGHNKLCMYMPFPSLPPVAGFLAAEREFFHPFDFNHPIGVHLFPGVSAVIANENGLSFDQNIKFALKPVMEPLITAVNMKKIDMDASRRMFVESAMKTLENDEDLAPHFTYLREKTGKK